jgi:AmmeMemoRadiSam system protein B
MLTVRRAAVAGSFYPDDPRALRASVEQFIESGRSNHAPVGSSLAAIIVPHAGYAFSGPIAGTAYAQLSAIADTVHRVVLVGPAHFVGFIGLAVSSADCFATPLGKVSINTDSVQRLLRLPQVRALDKAHAAEHSLEVQLPFLQVALDRDFQLTPIVVGQASAEEVAEALEMVCGAPETIVVVSSDLSHYHDYATAKRLDHETSRWIEALQGGKLSGDRACGYVGIRGLLRLAKQRGLHVTTLDVRNSGDTSGPREQVVGYGAYAIHA